VVKFGSQFIKRKNKKCICRFCNVYFYAADKKARICYKCKEKKSVCICGKIKCVDAKFCKNCIKIYSPSRGKTYEQRFGTKDVRCGFKKGLLNPNFTHRRKIITHSPQNKLNKYGEAYRSKLEVIFSELLHENNLPFEYEHKIKMINGKYKFVDFKIGDVLIEISGLAYKDWREKFFNQIKNLHATVNNPILLITYDDKYDMLWQISDNNIFTYKWSDVEKNSQHLIKTINFYQNIFNVNKLMESDKSGVCNI